MMEKIAFDLVKQYINSWKRNDLTMIVACLTEDCVVIESHGPTYHGISDVELWFKFWLAAKSKITKWDILSFYFCEKEETAFVEWDFSCISNGVQHSLLGISVVKFRRNHAALKLWHLSLQTTEHIFQAASFRKALHHFLHLGKLL